MGNDVGHKQHARPTPDPMPLNGHPMRQVGSTPLGEHLGRPDSQVGRARFLCPTFFLATSTNALPPLKNTRCDLFFHRCHLSKAAVFMRTGKRPNRIGAQWKISARRMVLGNDVGHKQHARPTPDPMPLNGHPMRQVGSTPLGEHLGRPDSQVGRARFLCPTFFLATSTDALPPIENTKHQ